MIYELEKQDYKKVGYIFQDQINRTVLNAIIQGNNPGKIYVDDVENPKTALIWAFEEMFFLGGDHRNSTFNNALNLFFTDVIIPKGKDIGHDYCQMQFHPSEKWREKLTKIFAERYPVIGHRWAFTFHPEKYKKLGQWKDNIPQGYSIKPIDNDLLNTQYKERALEIVGNFWSSFDEFYQKGMGFCLVDGERIITTCLWAFVCKGNYEISINTYRHQDRSKGFATLTARAFIDYCIEKNIIPNWGTETFRHHSRRVAEKLGFQMVNEYPTLDFLFDPFDNLIFNAYYYLAEAKVKDVPLAEDFVKKAFGAGDSDKGALYWLACGFAVAGEKKRAMDMLNKAVDKGYDNLDSLNNDEDFNNLRDCQEWDNLIGRVKEKI